MKANRCSFTAYQNCIVGVGGFLPHPALSFLRSVFCIAFWFTGLTAPGQSVPKLSSLSPEWLQRGSTVEMTLTGENLSSVTNVVFTGDAGLTATIKPSEKPVINVETSQGGISSVESSSDKMITAKVSIGTDATLRSREIRVISPSGISNPLTLNIGPLAEFNEKEPNNATNQAQKIELPAAVTGKIKEAGEIDYYRFTASKGQRLIFDVYAFRLGSSMDSSLAILDSSAKELAQNEDANGLDSLIAWTVPEDGEYLIQLRDFRYQGGGDFKYRLLAGVMPYVSSIFPLGGRRGQNVDVQLKGENLEGMSKFTLHLDPQAPLGPQQIRANNSNPFLFDVSNLADFLEKEPNNVTNKANIVTIPVAVNARISEEKDVDIFRFKVNRDQRLICEVQARRYGSPLDALLTLTDSQGTVLQQNDDADGADSRIDYDQFKKDGEYYISVKDLLDHHGENFAYRLAIRSPEPTFSVKALPDAVRIRRGGRAIVRCELSRQNGFDDAVQVAFADLPTGVFAEPLIFSLANPPSGLLILSASKDALLGTFPIKLRATGTIDGKSITQDVEPLSNDRPTMQAFLTVLDPPPFTIELSTLSVILEQNQTSVVDLIVQRSRGFVGEIKLSAEGFSAGRDPVTKSLEIQDVKLGGNESRTNLQLKAKLDSEVGTRNIVIKGETSLNDQNIVEYSTGLPVTIIQFPYVLSTSLKKLSVTALPPAIQSAASEAVFAVKVERRGGFTNEIPLVVEGVPEGVTVSSDKVPSNATEATIKLTATDKAPVGKEFSLTVSGTGSFNDRTYRQKTSALTLIIVAPAEAAESTQPANTAAK